MAAITQEISSRAGKKNKGCLKLCFSLHIWISNFRLTARSLQNNNVHQGNKSLKNKNDSAVNHVGAQHPTP